MIVYQSTKHGPTDLSVQSFEGTFSMDYEKLIRAPLAILCKNILLASSLASSNNLSFSLRVWLRCSSATRSSCSCCSFRFRFSRHRLLASLLRSRIRRYFSSGSARVIRGARRCSAGVTTDLVTNPILFWLYKD